jgi:uncharacterized damage-inducible protein DinB
MKKSSRMALSNVCVALALVPFAALAQTPAPTSSGGIKAEITKLMDDAETKLTKLAEAIPAGKYTWRPTKGVRTTSEVFLHVAGGNYFLANKIGAEFPAGMKREDFEKSTGDKAKVVETLKQSFEHAKQTVAKLSDADLDKTLQWFGGSQVTYRYAAMFLTAHQHEHLGQAIAYTRAMGIVPPWTEEQQKAAKAKPKT